MEENTSLLGAYQAIADEVTEWRQKHRPFQEFKPMAMYDRILELMVTDPEKFEALKLTPSMLIEVGLYANAKKAHEAMTALEEARNGN